YDELKDNPGLGAKPLVDNKIVILNNDCEQIPANSKGQVAVKSKSVTCGYYNNETATQDKFCNDYYLTSDYGFINDDGYLQIEGRTDDIIISGGENINPREIEDALLNHPAILEAVVIKMKDQKWGEVPQAVVRIKIPTEKNDLIDFLHKHLSSYKIPKEIFIVDKIPKNEMGKVNKEELKEELNIK
ncbi:class I adenylate-forming enzyme family protein, partial [Bacteroidota bacterium]